MCSLCFMAVYSRSQRAEQNFLLNVYPLTALLQLIHLNFILRYIANRLSHNESFLPSLGQGSVHTRRAHADRPHITDHLLPGFVRHSLECEASRHRMSLRQFLQGQHPVANVQEAQTGKNEHEAILPGHRAECLIYPLPVSLCPVVSAVLDTQEGVDARPVWSCGQGRHGDLTGGDPISTVVVMATDQIAHQPCSSPGEARARLIGRAGATARGGP